MNKYNVIPLVVVASIWVSATIAQRNNTIAELSEKLATCEISSQYYIPEGVSEGVPTHSLSYSF